MSPCLECLVVTTKLTFGVALLTLATASACSSKNTDCQAAWCGNPTPQATNETTEPTTGTPAAGATTKTPWKTCPTDSGTTTAKCSNDEIATYQSCLLTKCDAEYVVALGQGYKSGNFQGVCGDYYNCAERCQCGDSVCTNGCVKTYLSSSKNACMTALAQIGACTQENCPTPTCAKVP